VEKEELTRKIIGCTYTVYHEIDYGFLETSTKDQFGVRGIEVKRKVKIL
jgi:hypothetical protein